MTTIGEVRPALADILPARRVFSEQSGLELPSLLLHSLPKRVYPRKQSLPRNQPAFHHKSERLESFCARSDERQKGIS